MHIEVHHLLQYMLRGCDKCAVYSGLVLIFCVFFHPMAYHCGSFGYVLQFVPRMFSCNGPRKTYRTHNFWNTVQKQKITMQGKPQLWNRHGGHNKIYRATLLNNDEHSFELVPSFLAARSYITNQYGNLPYFRQVLFHESLQRFEFKMIHESYTVLGTHVFECLFGTVYIALENHRMVKSF